MSDRYLTATRPSTVANALDDKSGLMPYVASSTLRTIAAHPDLMTRLSLVRGEGWKDYRPLYDEAEARGGKREASDGTNIHMVVEALHHGMNVNAVPEPARSDGQAVFDAIAALGYRIVEAELFVVTQGLPELCAGTLDLLLADQHGRLLIGDTKSVNAIEDGRYAGIRWAIQTAIYNHGKPYAGPLPPDRDRWGRPKVYPDRVTDWPGRLDSSRALILQVERGKRNVVPSMVDTRQGWDLARAACEVRKIRKTQASLVTNA